MMYCTWRAALLRYAVSYHREELIREALDRDWVPLLMGWLGVNTRPAVQVSNVLRVV